MSMCRTKDRGGAMGHGQGSRDGGGLDGPLHGTGASVCKRQSRILGKSVTWSASLPVCPAVERLGPVGCPGRAAPERLPRPSLPCPPRLAPCCPPRSLCSAHWLRAHHTSSFGLLVLSAPRPGCPCPSLTLRASVRCPGPGHQISTPAVKPPLVRPATTGQPATSPGCLMSEAACASQLREARPACRWNLTRKEPSGPNGFIILTQELTNKAQQSRPCETHKSCHSPQLPPALEIKPNTYLPLA